MHVPAATQLWWLRLDQGGGCSQPGKLLLMHTFPETSQTTLTKVPRLQGQCSPVREAKSYGLL